MSKRESKALDRLKAGANASERAISAFHWFLQNHHEFAEVLKTIPRPSWNVITSELQADGITKKGGGPLTSGYVRQAWWKAEQVLAEIKAKSEVERPQPRPKRPRVVQPAQPEPADPYQDDEPDRRQPVVQEVLTLKPSRPRPTSPKET